MLARKVQMIPNHKSIEHLAAMVSALLVTDKSCSWSQEGTCFAGVLEDFDNLVVRALDAALVTLPYHEVMDIALEMQRRDMQASGIYPLQRGAA